MPAEDKDGVLIHRSDLDEVLTKIDHVRKRLYTETRLGGDEMRDLAHVLTATKTLLESYLSPEPACGCTESPCGHAAASGGMLLRVGSVVTCSMCGAETNAKLAHIHQGQWIGDDCCWDERLRASE